MPWTLKRFSKGLGGVAAGCVPRRQSGCSCLVLTSCVAGDSFSFSSRSARRWSGSWAAKRGRGLPHRTTLAAAAPQSELQRLLRTAPRRSGCRTRLRTRWGCRIDHQSCHSAALRSCGGLPRMHAAPPTLQRRLKPLRNALPPPLLPPPTLQLVRVLQRIALQAPTRPAKLPLPMRQHAAHRRTLCGTKPWRSMRRLWPSSRPGREASSRRRLCTATARTAAGQVTSRPRKAA